ncbi:MAG: hypothetical protein HY399_05110 [Elusimicrobia bacterium]|nr:hypothetical protein [Elusimicrobiota bacterium]
MENVAQIVFPGFWFGKTDPQEAERWVEMGVGGFCLYGGKPEEIRSFITKLQKKSKVPLLFCADYENGVGQWVPGGTEFPSNMAVAATGSEDFALKKGIATAREAKALGVYWVLAPVVDLASCPDNPIVNIRAFSDSPLLVSRFATSYLQGLKKEGVINCLKHFPGHGESRFDSHLELPLLNLSRAQLLQREVKPYQNLKDLADAVMVGHLKIPSLDKQFPTSLSRLVISDFLKKEMGYEGLVVTDALAMKAVSEDSQAGAWALEAGADILLVPEDPFKLRKTLERGISSGTIPEERVQSALKNLAFFRKNIKNPSQGSLDVLGCSEHALWAKQMAESALSWVRPPSHPPVKSGEKIFYLEPGIQKDSDWQGKAFVDELRKLGVRILSGTPSSLQISLARNQTQSTLVGIFSKPQAYSGAIHLNVESRKKLRALLEKVRRRVLFSFGSPFVFSGFSYEAGLCAFSDLEHSQRAAARALLRPEKAVGRWPVSL